MTKLIQHRYRFDILAPVEDAPILAQYHKAFAACTKQLGEGAITYVDAADRLHILLKEMRTQPAFRRAEWLDQLNALFGSMPVGLKIAKPNHLPSHLPGACLDFIPTPVEVDRATLAIPSTPPPLPIDHDKNDPEVADVLNNHGQGEA